MSKISMLRTLVNNGWTIANRKNIISQIGKESFEEISVLAAKTGRTGKNLRYCDAKSHLQPAEISATKEALTNTNTAYHGSPFRFDNFDVTKIGKGEGMNKYCKGIYLARTKRIAPFYANIRSKDAPLHFGSTKPLESATPTVYTVSGIDKLNLKLCTPIDAKKISGMQAEFRKKNPDIDGIELLNGEITIFPESVQKLTISNKKGVENFVKENPGYPFRTWTTDPFKIS